MTAVLPLYCKSGTNNRSFRSVGGISVVGAACVAAPSLFCSQFCSVSVMTSSEVLRLLRRTFLTTYKKSCIGASGNNSGDSSNMTMTEINSGNQSSIPDSDDRVNMHGSNDISDAGTGAQTSTGIDVEASTSPPNEGNGSWTHIAEHDDNDMVRHWKESTFAVGLTHPTWKDEPVKGCNDPWCCKPANITAICCRYCGVGRVGNMVVLWQRNVPYTNAENTNSTPASTTSHRPKLMIVLGPYWMVLVFVTIPIFAAISAFTFWSLIRNETSTILFILYLVCTCGLFVSLCMVGCRDPDILYRHRAPPVGHTNTNTTSRSDDHDNNNNDTEWQWNDQALTYRPIHAKYDGECAVVIERFDHTYVF